MQASVASSAPAFMSVAGPSAASPITQVQQGPVNVNLQPQLLTRLLLDLRGKRFEVDRETIMNLPESVLLCLFPNGLVLSRQNGVPDEEGNEEEEDVYSVDVSGIWVIFLSSVSLILRLYSLTLTVSDTC